MEKTEQQQSEAFAIKGKKIYTVFIGCIPGKTKPEDLKKKYEKLGKIFSIKLRKKAGKETGSGFGSFSTWNQRLYEHLISTPQRIHGRLITCRPYLDGKEKVKYLKSLNKRRIFITGLNSRWSDQEIFGFFSLYWEIEKAYAIRNSRNVSRGFGYVNFFKPRDAEEAVKRKILIFNGNYVECRTFQKNGKKNLHDEYPEQRKLNNHHTDTGHNNEERNTKFLQKRKRKILKLPNLDFSDKDQSIASGIARSRRTRRRLKKNHGIQNLRINRPSGRRRSTV